MSRDSRLKPLVETPELSEADIANFRSKVKARPGECWLWGGGLDQDGYGRFYISRRPHRAHRIALVIEGREIPDSLVVDHTCMVRSCVNPAHLRVVDRSTNVHENSGAAAHLNSLKSHCLRGHPLEGANLHVRKNGKRECLQCAADRARASYHAKRGYEGCAK